MLVPIFTMIRPTSEGHTVLSQTFLWRGAYPTIWSRDFYFGAGGHSGDRTASQICALTVLKGKTRAWEAKKTLGKSRNVAVACRAERGERGILASLVCLGGGPPDKH